MRLRIGAGDTPRPGVRVPASLLATTPILVGAWLFLAALPALADGGVHVAATNSGQSVLTADSCAGCHRAHTAEGEYLLVSDEKDLCLTCHGANSAGATTDVMTGVQYRDGTTYTRAGGYTGANGAWVNGTTLGALRSGGFDQARLSTGNPARRITTNALSSSGEQRAKVSVALAPADVTSAHLNLPGNGLTAPGVAWGNGPIGLGQNGPGPTVTLGCGSCHNPHGNGQYRILNPMPDPEATSGSFTPTAAPGVAVKDSPMGTPDATTGKYPTKNYTVLQVKGTSSATAYNPSTYMLYAQDVLDALVPGQTKWPAGDYSATGGDYWHVRVPWNSTTGANDAPNGIPVNSSGGGGGLIAFNAQMTDWCSACHTRYYSIDGHEPSGDALFTYRHETISNRACTTCHVAHGSNARMTGKSSATVPFPDGTTVTYQISGTTGDSRLLKVDNRGTCQLCHDPTHTEPDNQYRGPSPTPGVP